MKIALTTLLGIACVLGAGCQEEQEATVQGEGGRRLTLEPPEDVTVTRGDIAEVKIVIQREDLEGDVSVEFSKLPAGVAPVDPDKAIVGNEGLYNLQASEDADLVSEHEAMVTVKGPTGIGVSQPLMITVEKQE